MAPFKEKLLQLVLWNKKTLQKNKAATGFLKYMISFNLLW